MGAVTLLAGPTVQTAAETVDLHGLGGRRRCAPFHVLFLRAPWKIRHRRRARRLRQTSLNRPRRAARHFAAVKNHVLSANLSRHFLVFGVALFVGACGGGTDNGGTGGTQAAAGHGGSSSGTGGGAGTSAAGTTGSGGGGTTGTAGTTGTGGSSSGTAGTTGTAGSGGNTGTAGTGGTAGATGGGAAGTRRRAAARRAAAREAPATAGAAASGGHGGGGGRGGNAGQSGSGGAAGAAGRGGTTGRGGSGGGNVDGGVAVQDGATMSGGAFVRTAWTATYTCTGTCPAQGAADTADADTKRAFDGNRGTRWSTGPVPAVDRADAQVPALLHRRHETGRERLAHHAGRGHAGHLRRPRTDGRAAVRGRHELHDRSSRPTSRCRRRTA